MHGETHRNIKRQNYWENSMQSTLECLIDFYRVWLKEDERPCETVAQGEWGGYREEESSFNKALYPIEGLNEPLQKLNVTFAHMVQPIPREVQFLQYQCLIQPRPSFHHLMHAKFEVYATLSMANEKQEPIPSIL